MFNLSASKLNLFQDCPRCFWLLMVRKITRPSFPMPSIVNRFDAILKSSFDEYRMREELPPMIAGQIKGKLSQGMPKSLWHEEENGILLGGKPDDYFEIEKGLVIPFDHKTRAQPPVDIHPAHQLQLDTYTYLLKMNGFKTVNKGILAFYCPNIDIHNGITINCTIREVITDPIRVKELINRANDILKGLIPESGDDCEFCRWAQNQVSNNPLL